jgi:hypothetical protein
VKLIIALLSIAISFAIAANAAADVDPPSDVLLLDDVYYPYQPRVCTELKDGLDRLAADAKKAHYPVRVALIASTQDLGGIPQVFGKPQEYAQFLHSEIGRQTHGAATLAVMPGGFGFAPQKPEAKVLDDISVSDKADSNRLARAAIDAIPRLAQAAGKSVKKPSIGSACTTKGGSSALIFIVPVALLFLAGAAFAFGRRGSSPASETPDEQFPEP